MMQASSQRERKLVALLILLALVTSLWLLIIAPIVAGFSARAVERAELLRRYQANERTIASIPRLRRQAENQRETFRNYVITAPTSAGASAQIQDRLQRVVENAGGEIGNIENVATPDDHVKLRTSARLTLAQVATVLTQLQNEAPFLIVETLNIAADQAVISGRLESMEVSFEVSVPVVLAKSG